MLGIKLGAPWFEVKHLDALLVQAAVLGLRSIYQPGFELIKAEVMLLDLMPGSLYQGELDLEPETTGERAKLMATIHAPNSKYGRGTVHLANSGIDNRTRQWGMRWERLTLDCTTAWGNMPVAKGV